LLSSVGAMQIDAVMLDIDGIHDILQDNAHKM
jgi:hypothetical protein